MLQTEFLRSLNCNYERVLLDKNPEEKKYQYCMISRGGIKGLLSCSLRYINGLAYLYYDITSKQNLAQIYGKRSVTRNWLCDFMWSMERLGEELSRFLLDRQNILWYPQQIFQDLESNCFSFLYVPYYEGENGFKKLLEFLIEHIDYEDECLVECVYKMYEQYDQKGPDYLQSQIFRDAKVLEEPELKVGAGTAGWETAKGENSGQESPVWEKSGRENVERENEGRETVGREAVGREVKGRRIENEEIREAEKTETKKKEAEIKIFENDEVKRAEHERTKKGFGSIFKSKKKKDRDMRADYQKSMEYEMAGYAVAEDCAYEEEAWGKTIFIEEVPTETEKVHSIYTQEGRLLAKLDKDSLTIGKRKEEVDVVIEDISISRMHARILKEEDGIYLEDLNSTNGTFKNGLKMEPYEKRKLEAGDEIKLGMKEMIFR